MDTLTISLIVVVATGAMGLTTKLSSDWLSSDVRQLKDVDMDVLSKFEQVGKATMMIDGTLVALGSPW
jgi:hypothetical protein